MRRLGRRIKAGFATSGELVKALWKGPYWWLVPVLSVLLPVAVVLTILQASPIVAPFVYTLF